MAAAEVKKEIELEIAHVLFIDIVGYSKLLIDEQRDCLHTLNEIVRATEAFRAADAAGKLTRLLSARCKLPRRCRVIRICVSAWESTAAP